MKYHLTSATEYSLNGLVLISDGVSNSVTLSLNEAPFKLDFNSSLAFPVASSLGATLQFSGSGTVFPSIAVTFDSALYTLTITITGTVPPAGFASVITDVSLIYQS